MGSPKKIGEDPGGSWYYASGSNKGRKHKNPRSGKSYSIKYPDGKRREKVKQEA
jgi:hypothetical protein